jgi:RNA polymerase sigma-70 factor (ECF subfamily)
MAVENGLSRAADRRTDPLADLAARAVAGDRHAVRALLEAVTPSLLGVVRAIVGAPSDAEDAVQEALVGFVRALGAFRGDCSVLHYASRIAVRAALVARRRRRERPLAFGGGASERGWDDEAAAPGAPFDGGDDGERDGAVGDRDPARAARRRALLRALLEELPEVQAEALALRVVLGHSMEEVAAATGAPVNTVRSRLRLAKEALRRRIELDPHFAELLEGAP